MPIRIVATPVSEKRKARRGRQAKPKPLPSPGPRPRPDKTWPGRGSTGRRLPVGAEGIFGLGVKGKPHSSPEGRKATMKLARKRLRDRGGKNLRDSFKDLYKNKVPDPRRKPGPTKPIDPRSPYIKDRVMTPLRAKKAKGGRIGYQSGLKADVSPHRLGRSRRVEKKKYIPVYSSKGKLAKRLQGSKRSSPYAKGGRIGLQHGGRTRLLEELGRVEAEPSNRNRRAEISRVHGELNRGYKHGKRVKKQHGGSAQSHYVQHGYGPHRSSGKVLKGKKVGIQIK